MTLLFHKVGKNKSKTYIMTSHFFSSYYSYWYVSNSTRQFFFWKTCYKCNLWLFSEKPGITPNCGLANLIHINSYNMRKKNVISLYKFRSYFFTLGEVQASFSNLLTTANNYRNFLSDFFYQINHLALSIGIPKYPENWWFYVVKLQNFGVKMAIFVPERF